MYLRKLELKDAPLMLAWMHDESVTEKLRTDFASKTLQDAESFIKYSWEDNDNVNLAIASDEDEYMGTVSLNWKVFIGVFQRIIFVRYVFMTNTTFMWL